ncbi:MAG TPA: hypothetical protein PKM50_01400 [Methanoregula sp.]|nr:hypothetical protein [Methanoregula sp.]
MGSVHDTMQTFVAREIRSYFRNTEGWECRPVPSPSTRDMTCILSRDVRGRKESIALAVSYDEEPSTLSLDTVAATMNKKILRGKVLFVPKSADVSAVPGEIRIIPMSSFGFVDGNLVWLNKKKNAKHYPRPEQPAKSGAAIPAPAPHAA